MVQKGLKMHKKRQKIEFLDLKRRFFSLAELGGTPTPPLTENHRGKKKVFFLSGKSSGKKEGFFKLKIVETGEG